MKINSSSQSEEPKKVAFIVTENVSLGSVLNIFDPFRHTNRLSGNQLFQCEFFSLDGTPVTATNGMIIPVKGDISQIERRDIVVIAASYDPPEDLKPAILSSLNWHHRHGAMIWAVDQGVLLLVETGIVGDEKISAHWETISTIGEQWPHIQITDSLYSITKHLATCGGHTGALDMTLSYIYDQFGEELATAVVNEMLYSGIRPSETPIPNDHVFTPWRKNSILSRAIELMECNVEDPLRIADIAQEVGVSARQLEYLSQRYLSETPKQHYTRIRLQQARRLLIYSELDITEIAIACGFQSVSSFSRSFQRVLKVSPSGYRARFLREQARPYINVSAA